MNIKPHVWTVEEIQEMPAFGAKMGWFNGLVRHEGKLYWTEIFPGMGFAQPVTGKRLGIYPASWEEIREEHGWNDKKLTRTLGFAAVSFWHAIIDLFRYSPDNIEPREGENELLNSFQEMKDGKTKPWSQIHRKEPE
jgi:hypothetical protein